MKLFIVVTACSNKYGCIVMRPQVFKSKREAQKALTLEYHAAESEMSDIEQHKERTRNSFGVQNYECSYEDCVGGVYEVEVND